MQKTKLGVLLVGAAMMDDVVGLVMVNIVVTLGTGGTGGWPIARPSAASFGMFLVTLFLGHYLFKLLWCRVLVHLRPEEQVSADGSRFQAAVSKAIRKAPHLGFVLATAVLVIYVAIAAFIDASVLFAAFIAGSVVNFLWDIYEEQGERESSAEGASEMYETYYQAPMDYILVPFFFASIGFSIPITDIFRGSIVWKGIVYSILKILAKMAVAIAIYSEYCLSMWRGGRKSAARQQHTYMGPPENGVAVSSPPHTIALLFGLAMTARGQIGFLIASLSQSSGTLTLQGRGGNAASSSGEEMFLVIVWAVVICTIAGPGGVGIMVRRIKRQDGASYGAWI